MFKFKIFLHKFFEKFKNKKKNFVIFISSIRKFKIFSISIFIFIIDFIFFIFISNSIFSIILIFIDNMKNIINNVFIFHNKKNNYKNLLKYIKTINFIVEKKN